MRKDAIKLEELRLQNIESIEEYKSYHERHRIFPFIFKKRNHKRILDTSAGIGIVAKRIKENYNCEIICNEISPTCKKILKKIGLITCSFDIDNENTFFPFKDKTFDAIISLATIEHLMNIDHYIKEIKRILVDDGYLYISAPNYSGILYLIRLLITGKTFHDPMLENERYEFFSHIRYFTFRTLKEFITSFGFKLDTVYLPLPKESTRYKKLKSKNPIKAIIFRNTMRIIYKLSPRWASEPILCFKKNNYKLNNSFKKIIL